jgi:excinuclease UvrABC ATPase subunit
MSPDVIRVHGARVNNLKDVSVEIPKRRLTVFTGVSGSGKSSQRAGVIYTDLAMMAGVAITCEECEGKRRRPDRLRGHTRRPRRRPLDSHRRAPGGVRRR